MTKAGCGVGCVTPRTSVGVGGRGFLDALRWEFQVNPVNDMT